VSDLQFQGGSDVKIEPLQHVGVMAALPLLANGDGDHANVLPNAFLHNCGGSTKIAPTQRDPSRTAPGKAPHVEEFNSAVRGQGVKVLKIF